MTDSIAIIMCLIMDVRNLGHSRNRPTGSLSAIKPTFAKMAIRNGTGVASVPQLRFMNFLTRGLHYVINSIESSLA